MGVSQLFPLSYFIAGGTPQYIQSYGALANAYSAIDKNNEAVIVHNKAIANNPYIAEVYINAAVFLGTIGNHKEAIDLCKKALTIKPNSSEAYFNLGCAQGNMGDLNEAIRSFQKAIAIDPGAAAARNALARAYKLGSSDLAGPRP